MPTNLHAVRKVNLILWCDAIRCSILFGGNDFDDSFMLGIIHKCTHRTFSYIDISMILSAIGYTQNTFSIWAFAHFIYSLIFDGIAQRCYTLFRLYLIQSKWWDAEGEAIHIYKIICGRYGYSLCTNSFSLFFFFYAIAIRLLCVKVTIQCHKLAFVELFVWMKLFAFDYYYLSDWRRGVPVSLITLTKLTTERITRTFSRFRIDFIFIRPGFSHSFIMWDIEFTLHYRFIVYFYIEMGTQCSFFLWLQNGSLYMFICEQYRGIKSKWIEYIDGFYFLSHEECDTWLKFFSIRSMTIL